MKLNVSRILLWPLLTAAVLLPTTLGEALAQESITERPTSAFAFQMSTQVPLAPEDAYDRFVEVDAWWDHRFSEAPARFFLEPRPGGGFYEIFDDEGNGVLHATVIYAKRGETLRMNGPLGLSGYALDLVFTLTFTGGEGGTTVALDVRGAGEVEPEWPSLVQSVWHHFLVERYQPYAAGTLREGGRTPPPPELPSDRQNL